MAYSAPTQWGVPVPSSRHRSSRAALRALALLHLALGWRAQVAPAAAQIVVPQLVADLETTVPATDSERDSLPTTVARLGNLHLFLADDGRHGRELWRTDGTAEGTVRVSDFCPGSCDASPGPLAMVGDRLFVVARDGTGRALFVSDGSDAGTRLVRRLPGTAWGAGAAYDGRFYFAVFNDFGKSNLWRSDGTAEGTEAFCTDCNVASPLVVFDGWLFFQAAALVGPYQLWRTDGTLENTHAIGGCVECQDGPPVLGGEELFLGRNHPSYGLEPWVLDSATSEPRLLADLRPGNQGSLAYPIFAWRGAAYMKLENPPGTWAWYRSDGDTPAIVHSLHPYGKIRPSDIVMTGADVLFFVTWNGTANELWALGPGQQGSRRLAQLFDQFLPLGTVRGLAAEPERALFATAPSGEPFRLWSSDGTAGGTGPLGDLRASYSSRPPAGAAGGTDLLLGLDGGAGLEPWITDGTAAGTRSLGDLKARASGDPDRLTGIGGKLYFRTHTGPWGSAPELYGVVEGSDGAARVEGTPEPWELAAAGGRLVVTDGQQLATVDAASDAVAPLPSPPTPFRLVSWGSRVALGDFDSQELWLTDGTPEGTLELLDIGGSVNYCNFTCPGGWPTYPQQITPAGDHLYFVGIPPDSSQRILRTDGTEPRTAVVEPPSLLDFADVEQLLALRDGAVAVSFVWHGSASYAYVLWAMDPAGSRSLHSSPAPLVLLAELGGRVFFGRQTSGGDELWATDGTSDGTGLVTALGSGVRVTSGPSRHDPDALAPRERSLAAGGRLYFTALDPTGGEEPWVSDGTAGGTRRLADLRPGLEGSHPTAFAAHGHCALFAATDGVRGYELWGSDGDGTFLVADLAPGGDGSSPGALAGAGERLFFAADDGIHGRELFAIHAAELESRCTEQPPPEPPPGQWLTGEAVPGFRLKARFGSAPATVEGTSAPCVAQTLCVAGARPGRAELLARIVGPRPNGRLWPHLVKLTPSLAEVWVEQEASGEVRYYRLEATPRGDDRLAGLFDREGFRPGPPVPATGSSSRSTSAADGWLTTPAIPGFRFRVRLGNAGIQGAREHPCLPATLCVSGALPGRPEVFVRITGPRPNGRLWPLVARLNASRVEVDVEQIATGIVRRYELPAPARGSDRIDGLVDRVGFAP